MCIYTFNIIVWKTLMPMSLFCPPKLFHHFSWKHWGFFSIEPPGKLYAAVCVCVCVCVCVLVAQSYPAVCDTMNCSPLGPSSMRFSKQEYWSGLHFLLQGIFPTQQSNPGLLGCRQILHHVSQREATVELKITWIELPRSLSCKEPACQFRRSRFSPWVRKILWRRKWQAAPVFLPGKSHGQRNLAGYSPWDNKRDQLRLNNNTDILTYT